MRTRVRFRVGFVPLEWPAICLQGKYWMATILIVYIGVPQMQILYANPAQYLVVMQL